MREGIRLFDRHRELPRCTFGGWSSVYCPAVHAEHYAGSGWKVQVVYCRRKDNHHYSPEVTVEKQARGMEGKGSKGRRGLDPIGSPRRTRERRLRVWLVTAADVWFASADHHHHHNDSPVLYSSTSDPAVAKVLIPRQ
jgi:hypothetical protein